MSIAQAPVAAHPGGVKQNQAILGSSKQKTAAPTGGFQALLQNLLSGLKKGRAEGSADKQEARLAGLRKPQTEKPRQAGNAPAKATQARAVSLVPPTALNEKAILPETGKEAKAARAKEEADSAKNPKKQKAPEDQATLSARSGEMAAMLSLNAAQPKAKAEKKEADSGSQDLKADSAQKKDKNSIKPRIDVIDKRRDSQAKGAQAVEGAEAQAKESGQKKPSGESQLTLDLSSSGSAKLPVEADAGAGKASDPGSFSSRLAQRLQDTYNAEIVQHSAVILRDGDSGLIRLNLKPESLGNVKVRLDLADNNITGTIIVESDAARDAFEADLEHLTKTFIDSGFQDAKLSVSVDSGASGNQGRQESRDGQRGFAEAARALDTAVPRADAAAAGGWYGRDSGRVDIFI